MSDIVIPKGDYVEIVKPICINPFGDYFINIKRGSRLRLSKDLWSITIADRIIEAMRGVQNA